MNMTCNLELSPCGRPARFPLGKEMELEQTEDEQPEIKSCSTQHKLFDFKLLMKIRQESVDALEQTYNVRRLGARCTQPWNPSDLICGKCTAVVRFKVDRPVNIESFGFYGPFEVGVHGKYHVDISILTEGFCEIASSTTVTPIIRNSDIFHVKFDSSVPLLPCLWYMAKFSLLGPPTSQSRKVVPCVRVKCGDFGETKFTFEMPDSNQLPEIGFSVRT